MSSLLHAGPFSVRYRSGELRDLRFGDREVLRRIYPVFQDLNWTNRGWRILDESITQHDDSFEVTVHAVNVAAPFEETSVSSTRGGLKPRCTLPYSWLLASI